MRTNLFRVAVTALERRSQVYTTSLRLLWRLVHHYDKPVTIRILGRGEYLVYLTPTD